MTAVGSKTQAKEAFMPHEVHQRDEVQALIDLGAQLVEVLGSEEFEEEHLPGAINLPLRKIETEAVRQLDPGKPVVVYCWDSA
jgi:rhodanese-related sulfurtransferase